MALPIGFFNRTTASCVSNSALLGLRMRSRKKRLSLFRSTALFTNFLATAIPKSPLVFFSQAPKYRPQFFVALGLVVSNSLMRALFKRLRFKLPGVYGPWRGAHLIRCGHHVFSCEHEIHGYVYDGLLMVDMFFS